VDAPKGESKSYDDYRFVYLGPEGSWTPLHVDVLRSYSWSANLCGRKHWLFFPPSQSRHLYDAHGTLLSAWEGSEASASPAYPTLDQVQPISVIQEAGEAIFVPSGWHHQELPPPVHIE